jgi:hypothetical protein
MFQNAKDVRYQHLRMFNFRNGSQRLVLKPREVGLSFSTSNSPEGSTPERPTGANVNCISENNRIKDDYAAILNEKDKN